MDQVSRLSDELNQKLEYLWKSAGAWPEYQQVMRLALSAGRSDKALPGERFSHLESLPGLCCQAAGGAPDWADDLTLAWLLYYAAAHLMDSVQDNDDPGLWWVEQGAKVALSAASGLYFSATTALNNLAHHKIVSPMFAEIVRDFSETLLVMGSGQYADLIRPAITLEQYWEQAGSKSGAFFSLACRTGARLATAESRRLEAYASYGRHLGLLVQITDDLEDVSPPKDTGVHGQRRPFARSLPVIYALEVFPSQQAKQLQGCLQDAPLNAEAAQQALDLVDQSGAAEYVTVVIEQHKSQALQALAHANPYPPAGEALAALVREI